MQAKKSLGQHFLKSEKALRQIVDAGDIRADDIVLEVGPGTGILTNRLIRLADKVIAVEKDRELVIHLRETFAEALTKTKLDIVEQDILTFDTEQLRFYGKQYKLIANIPYYITGAIIEQFLSASFQPSIMVLLIQKEVAERIVARDKKESILSIAVKAYGTPRIIDKVPPGAFAPAPTVDSAIIAITGISRDYFTGTPESEGCDETQFFAVLKSVFGKKRKQIGKSLGEYLSNKEKAVSILSSIDINTRTRPEDMTLAHWKQLTRALTHST